MRLRFLIVFLAGCGFLGETEFTGTRTGDGIAPWADLGPAQVCLGEQYLGAPDSPPGGLCFAENVQQKPCTQDSECRSREACVCGTCTVPFCSAASDCGANRVCTFSDSRCDLTCFVNNDCPDGAECHNGVCRGRCITDADCQTGEVCNSQNFCATAKCSDDSGCLTTETCRLQRTPRQVEEPSPMVDDTVAGGPVVLWLEVADPLQRVQTAIWRAVSRDGVHFTMVPAQPVLTDGTTAKAPSVVREPDGTLAMYYEDGANAAIKEATSADGITWSTGTQVLSNAHAPSAVVLPDGHTAIYYQVGDGSMGIGLAIDGADQGVVLTPAQVTVNGTAPAPFWKGVSRLTSPFAAVTTRDGAPSLRLWFSAYGQESADSQQFGQTVPILPNYSIGYAASDPNDPGTLEAWPYGPVVDRVTAFLAHHDEFFPGVAQIDDTDGYLMYYVEADPAMNATPPDGPYTIGRLAVLGNGSYSSVTAP
jgi:hypothetical protein